MGNGKEIPFWIQICGFSVFSHIGLKYELGTHEVILDSTVPSVTAPNATFLT